MSVAIRGALPVLRVASPEDLVQRHESRGLASLLSARTPSQSSRAGRQESSAALALGASGAALGRQLFRRRRSARRGLALTAISPLAAGAEAAVRQALQGTAPEKLLPPRPGKEGPRKLRPLIVAMGTRGDVEPCLRLGKVLKDRGHHPVIMSLGAYAGEVKERWGLPFVHSSLDRVPLSPDYLTGNTRADQVYADRGWYGDAWVPVGRAVHQAVLEHNCDMIVSTSMANTHSLDVAESLGLLCFAVKFSPDIDGQIPTAVFPPSGYPAGMPGPLNVAAHILENLRTVGAVFMGGFIPRVIQFRKELGLPCQKLADGIEVPTYSPYRQALQANQPCLYAFSEALVDRPPEYQNWHFVTGAMGKSDLEMAEKEVLPPGLAAFLDGAEAEVKAGKSKGVVCIAFGSITLARSAPFQERAVAAARRLGAHVVIVDPDAAQEGVSSTDSAIYSIKSVPYAILFPRCSLVVHHGGAGTMQDCLWASIPQVAAPVLKWSDQPFWAAALEERGIGLALGQGAVAPEAEDWDLVLKSSFERAQELRLNARRVAQRAESEFGAGAACDILESALLSSH